MPLLFVVGCATAPPAIPVCTEITMSKAYCINTMTSEEFYIDDTNKMDGKTYWELRPMMLLLMPTSWAKLKTYIITQCHNTGKCDKAVGGWERTIQSIDNAVRKK